MKKTLYMETTSKEPEQTAAEIQKVLKYYNLKQFLYTYSNGEINGLFFQIDLNGNEIGYKLPIDYQPIWNLAQQGKTKYARTKEQCRRVAWRQILKWIESQLALINTGMVKFEQVFMPYMLIDDNTTAFEKISEQVPALKKGGLN